MTLFRHMQYRGVARQALRNVAVASPSIFWVQRGSKVLHGMAQDVVVDEQHLLLVPARQRLTFVNEPGSGEFLSLQFSFHVRPKAETFSAMTTAPAWQAPLLPITSTVRQTLLLLAQGLTDEAASHGLGLLYQLLAEQGALHYLFSAAPASISEQLQRFFSQRPEFDHQLMFYCAEFAMSRATLLRHLQAEGTSFRQLLLDVRMNHALSLMQQDIPLNMLAPACGYDSTSRFSSRFTAHFGMAPSAYLRTLKMKTKNQ